MNENEVDKDVIDGEQTNIKFGEEVKDDNEEPFVEADETILEAIELSLDELNLSFDIDELKILDDEKARPRDLEALKENLGPTVPARLFSLANSVHFGRISSGKITRFTDVVTRLGTDFIQATAFFIAFLRIGPQWTYETGYGPKFCDQQVGRVDYHSDKDIPIE